MKLLLCRCCLSKEKKQTCLKCRPKRVALLPVSVHEVWTYWCLSFFHFFCFFPSIAHRQNKLMVGCAPCSHSPSFNDITVVENKEENKLCGHNWRRWRLPTSQSGSSRWGQQPTKGQKKCLDWDCVENWNITEKNTRKGLSVDMTTENTKRMLCCQLCLVTIDRVESIWMEPLWICLTSQFTLSLSLSHLRCRPLQYCDCFNAKILCKWASEYNGFFLCSHQILLLFF